MSDILEVEMSTLRATMRKLFERLNRGALSNADAKNYVAVSRITLDTFKVEMMQQRLRLVSAKVVNAVPDLERGKKKLVADRRVRPGKVELEYVEPRKQSGARINGHRARA